MQDAIRVLAGDCTVEYANNESHEQRGEVVVLVKPDNTVLVHDAEGYQPAAWLTRADVVRFANDAAGFRLIAGRGDERLRVESHANHGHVHYPVSPSGPEVGECPACGRALVRDRGDVVCVGCLATYPLPQDATMLDESCEDCGLPRFRVDRGATVEVCLDRDCESIDDAIGEQIDGEWTCQCGGVLRVCQDQVLRVVCEECGKVWTIPNGVAAGTCGCGLPLFETSTGVRCLNNRCGSLETNNGP